MNTPEKLAIAYQAGKSFYAFTILVRRSSKVAAITLDGNFNSPKYCAVDKRFLQGPKRLRKNSVLLYQGKTSVGRTSWFTGL
jgi:hypothetical protein